MATNTEIKAFIKKLGRLAVAETNQRIIDGKGFVLPSVCIAMSALETHWGTAGLMVKANAFFGIKAGGSWKGKVYRADTWEVADGVAYNTVANFRAYDSLEDSVRDFYDLIGGLSRYSNALSYGLNMSAWKTSRECVSAIHGGGYATDDNYVTKIMNTLNARNLDEYNSLVDGVSGTASSGSSSSLPEYKSFTFKKADFIQGGLLITDSGRTVSNEPSLTTAISTNWENAITIDTTQNFKFSGLGTLQAYVFKLVEDVASMSGPYKDGDVIQLIEGEKIGIMLDNNGEDISPDSLANDFVLELDSAIYPDGVESYSTGIAFFVKVE